MADTKQLLEVRRKAKKAKPNFVVKESKFSARVKARWRFPRGKHSAVRQRHLGRPALATPGYGSPRSVRGLHSSGLREKIVHNTKDLRSLSQEEGAVIASTVGLKKKLELLKLASEKKVAVLNVKDLAKKMQEISEVLALRKKSKKSKLDDKAKKEEEKAKKAAEKKQHAEKEKKSEENKEETEKKQKEEFEKTLTKKQ